jgi:peptidoglycan/LPS O-acetylase OafA/YrhL
VSSTSNLPRGEPGAKGHVRALDGMRAVAVILVVLFHLQVPGFAAGYLGVDVFFVLSGFLITSLLIAEMQEHGRIALAAFWSRRVRRLLPALALLLLGVALVTWLTATYSQRASIRGDLLASTAYLANWRFIATSSYFLNTGVESPLQHTWSLAIEEQFYLLWPLVLAGAMAVVHRARMSVTVLAVLGVIASSIAMAWLFGPDGVERAYMGTDARLFEPLVGALGAVWVATPGARAWLERRGRPILWLGVLVVLVDLVVIRPGDAYYFDGGALGFSVATLMIVAPLWVGRGGPAEASLSWRPVAWVGVVSYGIYLWHWPLIVWLGVRTAVGLRAVLLSIAALVLTVAMAALSYYLVERPIRTGQPLGAHGRRRWRLRRPGVVLAAVPLVLLLVASASVAATRVPPVSADSPVLLLIGDSVPLHLEVAFERATAARGWRVVSAAQGGCSVTGDIRAKPNGEAYAAATCDQDTIPAQDQLIAQDHPDVVLWWDRWSLSDFLTADGEHVRSGSARFWALRRSSLDAAVRRLGTGGATVVFVATEPPGVGMWTRCSDEQCADWDRFQIDRYADITSRWNAILQRYAQHHPDRAAFLSVTDAVCHDDASPCNDLIGAVPARPDGTHYEGAGEELVTGLIMDAIAARMDGEG